MFQNVYDDFFSLKSFTCTRSTNMKELILANYCQKIIDISWEVKRNTYFELYDLHNLKPVEILSQQWFPANQPAQTSS